MLTLPTLAGGLVGSLFLTRLDPHYFDTLVPWLILTAALLFLFQPLLTRWAHVAGATSSGPWTVAGVLVFQFFVSVYGGYFGAGIGILMLSSLSLTGLGSTVTSGTVFG